MKSHYSAVWCSSGLGSQRATSEELGTCCFSSFPPSKRIGEKQLHPSQLRWGPWELLYNLRRQWEWGGLRGLVGALAEATSCPYSKSCVSKFSFTPRGFLRCICMWSGGAGGLLNCLEIFLHMDKQNQKMSENKVRPSFQAW